MLFAAESIFAKFRNLFLSFSIFIKRISTTVMFYKIFLIAPIFIFFLSKDSETRMIEKTALEHVSKFSLLSEVEKREAIHAFLNGNCKYKDIQLYGKVKFVTSFPDIKIKYVESFPDIKVKFVSSFPDSCGKWQEVNSFPDFTVEVVDAFPDLKVQVVNSFPGMN